MNALRSLTQYREDGAALSAEPGLTRPKKWDWTLNGTSLLLYFPLSLGLGVLGSPFASVSSATCGPTARLLNSPAG